MAAQERRAKRSTPQPQAFTTGGVAVCAADGSNRATLEQTLRQLSLDVRRYQDTEPRAAQGFRPLARRVQALLAEPCLAVARQEIGGAFEPQSAAAFLDWWSVGKSWLGQHLEAYQGQGNSDRRLPLAPRLRLAVNAQALPADPLKHLLCKSADEPCEGVARGWALRARDALETKRALSVAQRDRYEQSNWERLEQCQQKIATLDPADQYDSWYSCMVEPARAEPQWPLQGYQAPVDGWLILVGRRGHYSFCDEIRAYDLASGSAYVSQSCSGFHFSSRQAGVDHDATAAANRYGVLTGQLGVEALREAAWMLFMLRHTQRWHYPRGSAIPIPADVHIGRRRPLPMDAPQAPPGWRSSADTQLRWAYLRGKETLVFGTITWLGGNGRATDQHALDLLQIAEASLLPGCAKLAAPTALPLDRLSAGVSQLDSSKATLNTTYAQLFTQYRAAASGKCGTLTQPLSGSGVTMDD